MLIVDQPFHKRGINLYALSPTISLFSVCSSMARPWRAPDVYILYQSVTWPKTPREWNQNHHCRFILEAPLICLLSSAGTNGDNLRFTRRPAKYLRINNFCVFFDASNLAVLLRRVSTRWKETAETLLSVWGAYIDSLTLQIADDMPIDHSHTAPRGSPPLFGSGPLTILRDISSRTPVV
ncbi:hypothetical protein BC826DRAFT_1038681 [Russula brevipes]|nr:hypothetical protein BC826DRAFT_1038681 [Russula brevipes]